MNIVPVILLTAACFVAAILYLALNTKEKNRVMGLCAVIAVATGLLSYGYANASADTHIVLPVLRALLATCRMFGGVIDFQAVSQTPLFQNRWIVALFWLGHFLAFFVTCSAAIELLGRRLLKSLRLRMLRRGALSIVYDASRRNSALAGHAGKDRPVVLVAPVEDAETQSVAEVLGGVLFADAGALGASTDFLKRVGVNRQRAALDVYCLSADHGQNLRYAEALRDALERMDIAPDAASLFLLGVPEHRAFHLIAQPGRHGYGSVFACERHELLSRLAVSMLPPWTCVEYDGVGRAKGDFSITIVGFGRMGRAVLRYAVMNGQMEGSTFHARVYDPRMEGLRCYMETCYGAMLDAYDIALIAQEMDSRDFYDSLVQAPPSVVALCTGSRRINARLAMDIENIFRTRPHCPHILQFGDDDIIIDGKEYHPDNLTVRDIDRRAMVLNHIYCGGATAEDDWRACDPFSRASSRASADFCPAFLHALGVERAGLERCWPPSAEILENLARTEHLRWCAFHLAMGYRPMRGDEFESRCQRYRGGEKLRVSKDAESMTHACLVPWEALDSLSERENAVTGGHVDYKAMDVQNVLALPEILKR